MRKCGTHTHTHTGFRLDWTYLVRRTFFKKITHTHIAFRTCLRLCMCVCVGVCILQWQMPAGPGQMMETIANCSIRQSNLANLIFSFVCHPLPPSAPPPYFSWPICSAAAGPNQNTERRGRAGRHTHYQKMYYSIHFIRKFSKFDLASVNTSAIICKGIAEWQTKQKSVYGCVKGQTPGCSSGNGAGHLLIGGLMVQACRSLFEGIL